MIEVPRTPKRFLNLIEAHGMMMPDELLTRGQIAYLSIMQTKQRAYADGGIVRFLCDHEIATFENEFGDFLKSL